MQDFAFTYVKKIRGGTPGPPLDRLALRARVEHRLTFTPPSWNSGIRPCCLLCFRSDTLKIRCCLVVTTLRFAVLCRCYVKARYVTMWLNVKHVQNLKYLFTICYVHHNLCYIIASLCYVKQRSITKQPQLQMVILNGFFDLESTHLVNFKNIDDCYN